MIADYDRIYDDPDSKPGHAGLWKIITDAQHDGKSDVTYYDKSGKVSVHIDKMTPRTADMMYYG